MRGMISIVGILLILFGIVTLGYQGITYTKQEKIAQIGDIQVTADKEKTIWFPPLVGGISLVAGIILVISSRR